LVKDSRNVSHFLNLVSVSLLSGVLVIVAYVRLTDHGLPGKHHPERIGLADAQFSATSFKGELPNIYYIVPDTYARGDVLKQYYGFDNREFLDHLESRGFYVAHRSCANSAQTTMSLASSLNLKYLDRLEREMGKNSRNQKPLISLIRNNYVVKFLKCRGYRYVRCYSGSFFTGPRAADVFVKPD